MLLLCTLITVPTYPSQVPLSSIKIRFYEDPRASFTGYAVADITWNPPAGGYNLGW